MAKKVRTEELSYDGTGEWISRKQTYLFGGKRRDIQVKKRALGREF